MDIKNKILIDLKNNYVHISDIFNRWPSTTKLPVIAISHNNDWDDYSSQLKIHIECSVQDVLIQDDGCIKIKCYDDEDMFNNYAWLHEDLTDEEIWRIIDNLDWQPMIVIEVFE